jgi:glutamate/tyrosine decarboxylase-like PLP-dependent enzyme
MSMKEQGVDRIGAAIQTNIEQAQYLARRVAATPGLELLAPVAMNIVCFRHVAPGLDVARLNALNQALLVALQVRGIAVPSQTVLDDRFAIRVCVSNHRSELADFDALIDAVVAIGAELAAQPEFARADLAAN